MSAQCYWPHKKGQQKIILGKYKIYLGKSWDLVHGKGWFCQAHIQEWCPILKEVCSSSRFDNGFGHSKNKFTAVRKAIANIQYSNFL